jgi:sphingolipid 4-desaturase/C4-monooxygenase
MSSQISIRSSSRLRVRADGADKDDSSSNNQNTLDAASSVDQFFWTYTEEPHRSRRLAIIKAHPEVSNGKPSTLE